MDSEDPVASLNGGKLLSWPESRNKTSAEVTREKKKPWAGEDRALRINREGDEFDGSDLVEHVGSISGISQAYAGKPCS